MKLLILVILTFLFLGCGGSNRHAPPPSVPAPTVEPQPVATPDPKIPIAWATPYPVPSFDPISYIPAPMAGRTVHLLGSESEDYSAKIQSVQDDPSVGTVVIGPGSLKRSVILRKTTRIETTPENPLTCDMTEGILPFSKVHPITDYGCMLVADGVHVSGTYKAPQALLDYIKFGNGRNWATDPYFLKLDALTEDQIAGSGSTILEPDCQKNKQPCVEVFQALNGVGHLGQARDIAITGIIIKGRQTLYDGGVRSSILLENCIHCTAQNNFLWNTASIGITAGG